MSTAEPSYVQPTPSARSPHGVLLLNEAFTPLVDGVINVVQSLQNTLQTRGIYAHVVTAAHPGYVESDETVTRLPSLAAGVTAPYRIPLPCNVFRRLPPGLQHRIDVVHLHSGFAHARAVMKWARYYNKPVLFTVHTKFAQKFEGALGSVLGGLLYRDLVSFISEADLITCPGQRFMEELAQSGIPRRKLQVVRNGVPDWPKLPSTRKFDHDPLIERARAARRAGCAVLLFVGQHIREKNPHFLLDALARLSKLGQRFLCIFVGGGDQTRALMRQAEALGIREDVMFVGRIFDRARLSMLYELADLMTFPSTFETSGLVLMEAAQHGLATLGITGSSGIGENIRDGENGFLAPLDVELYAARICTALADEMHLARVRKQARLTLARSKDAMVDEYLALYESLANPYAGHRPLRQTRESAY
jgi:1,2-diacylglycerol 3-alpha-glucosyltransferase